MSNEETIVKTRGISSVWTLPIIALLICGWLIWTSLQDHGIDIEIVFDDATGIVPGKTQVMAKGIPVGLVKKIIPDLKNNNIKAIIEMDQAVTPHLVEDTLFWIVRPELSASSVQGLDTILSGSYIGIQVGSSAVQRESFVGLNSAPPISPETPGLHLQLRADELGSIQAGTGIYFRNIQVGTVQSYRLEKEERILIDIFIKPEFSHLVHQESRFCNASGLEISGKLTNLKLQMESLASLLRGGILLHTPEQLKDSPLAENGHQFPLYPDYEAANYGIPMTLTLSSGQHIVEGDTKVIYRGLEAGFVKEIQINSDSNKLVTAHIMLDPRAELILREKTRFWLVKPEISTAGIKNLHLLLAGPHITFEPGSGNFQDHFELLAEPPPQRPLRDGRSFVLEAGQAVSVSANSPVYYKNIPVGEVISSDIHSEQQTFSVTIFIYQKYLPLVTDKSLFWVSSGLQFEAGLDTGLNFSTGPLSLLLHGGISFITPEPAAAESAPPEEGHLFPLFSDYKELVKATPILQTVGIRFKLLADNVRSLTPGKPILHKNLQIGEITALGFSKDHKKAVLDCLIYKKYQNIIHSNTRFYNISGIDLSASLEKIEIQTGSLQALLSGGVGCINPEPGDTRKRKSSYFLYNNLETALKPEQTMLTFYVTQLDGLKVGSPIRYKNIDIGKIRSISFSEDFKTLECQGEINKSMESLFTEATVVWIDKTEIGLDGIKNLGTVLFGSYLHFLPGIGKPARTFKVLNQPPRRKIAGQDGLGVVLETSHLGSISRGSPVYYRQVQIGKISDLELSATFQKVYIYATIFDKYRTIVRKNTQFWNTSGIKIEGGLFSGLSINTESLLTLIQGGISLATPDNGRTYPPAPDGHHFVLHEQPQKEWLDWNPNVMLLEQEDQHNLTGKAQE